MDTPDFNTKPPEIEWTQDEFYPSVIKHKTPRIVWYTIIGTAIGYLLGVFSIVLYLT